MEPEYNLSVEYVPDKKEKGALIPLEFERHMTQVVGDAYDIMPNSIKDLDLKDLKGLFKRYLDILLRTYKVNIEPLNKSLMKCIEYDIETSQGLIKNVKSIDELCLLMFGVIGDLNLLIIGGRLDNTPKDNRRSRISNNQLKLDHYCAVHYTQTACQKANLICDYVQMTRPPECLKQIESKRLELKDDESFIEWVKNDDTFVKVYLELF